jgi:hypothetical protein
VPIFPELREYFFDVIEQAEPRTRYGITCYRDGDMNLRTQLQKIIKQASLKP